MPSNQPVSRDVVFQTQANSARKHDALYCYHRHVIDAEAIVHPKSTVESLGRLSLRDSRSDCINRLTALQYDTTADEKFPLAIA